MSLALILTDATLVLLCTLALLWSRWPAWLKGLLVMGMKKARQGISQMGTAVPKAGKKGLGWLRPGADEQDVKIRDLPAPQLPEK